MAAPSGAAPAGLNMLSPCLCGVFQESLKGQDGIRIQRMLIGGESVIMALLCDGHRGKETATLVLEMLIARVIEEVRGDPSQTALGSAAERSFEAIDKRAKNNPDGSGSTVTLVIVNEARGELTCASVGDSLAVLVTVSTYRSFTDPNKPMASIVPTLISANDRLETNEAERNRVLAAGGQLERPSFNDGFTRMEGPMCAYPGRLLCAKAIGYGDMGAKYVSCKPKITKMPFPPEGGALIIASDGVWDSVSQTDASKTVAGCADASEAAERLCKQAIGTRGIQDDTTAIVLVGGGHALARGELDRSARGLDRSARGLDSRTGREIPDEAVTISDPDDDSFKRRPSSARGAFMTFCSYLPAPKKSGKASGSKEAENAAIFDSLAKAQQKGADPVGNLEPLRLHVVPKGREGRRKTTGNNGSLDLSNSGHGLNGSHRARIRASDTRGGAPAAASARGKV